MSLFNNDTDKVTNGTYMQIFALSCNIQTLVGTYPKPLRSGAIVADFYSVGTWMGPSQNPLERKTTRIMSSRKTTSLSPLDFLILTRSKSYIGPFKSPTRLPSH